jgi:hypothetical protein
MVEVEVALTLLWCREILLPKTFEGSDCGLQNPQHHALGMYDGRRKAQLERLGATWPRLAMQLKMFREHLHKMD